MSERRVRNVLLGSLLISAILATLGEGVNVFVDDHNENFLISTHASTRTTSRAKLFERKRNECLGLMLSISRKCKRAVRRKVQKEQCMVESECQAAYKRCHDRLRRRHFIRERSCQKVTRGRVPLCKAETRFITSGSTPGDPKFDERQLRIFERLSNITDPELLTNPETPQGQAFNWIAKEDELELDVHNATLDQRYILATLYFATNGDGWDRCYRGAPERNCRPIVVFSEEPHTSAESTAFIRYRGDATATNFCLGVSTATHGENLKLGECDENNMPMLWDLDDDRLLRLRERPDLCAGVSNRNSNQVVELFECDPSIENRRWRFNSREDSEFTVSGTNLCLTTENGNNPRLGDAITITQCDGNFDQRWDYDGRTLSTTIAIPSFLSPLHECDWFGIESCLNGTNVESISLARNNLIGILPGELRHLRYLERLSLPSNHLAGLINPHSFPENLIALYLNDNSHIGIVPRLDLPFLKQLDLSENKISGGLDALFQSLPRNISGVLLGSNRFNEEVPAILSEFTSLNILDLSLNWLNGTIPEVLCNNSEIYIRTPQHDDNCPREIKCSCCRDRPCPTPAPTFAPTISQPPSISLSPTVDLDETYRVLSNVTDIATLEDATTPQGRALRWLLREDERHLQPDDPTLTQRYIMAVLYFSTDGDNWSKCFADATPEECGWWGYSNRDYQPFLSQASECFWGMWESNACNRDGLITSIRIPGNNLLGNLPLELAALPDLRNIELSRNSIYGILPSVWPPKLDTLQLDRNRLSGPIVGEFPAPLNFLNLEGNALNGTVDALIVALNRTKVSYLNLRSNHLIGSIPATLADLSPRDTFLREAIFEDNDSNGTMPREVCEARKEGQIGRIFVDCPPDGVKCSCCSNRCPPTPMPTQSPTVSSAPSVSPAPSDSPSVSKSPTSSPAPTTLTNAPTEEGSRSISQSFSFSASFSISVRRRLSRAEDGNRIILRKKYQAKRQ